MTAPSRSARSFRSATAARFALAFGVLAICLVLEAVLGSSHASSGALLAVAAAGIVFGGGGALVTARRMHRALAYNIERQNAIRSRVRGEPQARAAGARQRRPDGPSASEDQGDRARPTRATTLASSPAPPSRCARCSSSAMSTTTRRARSCATSSRGWRAPRGRSARAPVRWRPRRTRPGGQRRRSRRRSSTSPRAPNVR